MTERMLGQVQVWILTLQGRRRWARDRLDSLPTNRYWRKLAADWSQCIANIDEHVARLRKVEDYLLARLGRVRIETVDGQVHYVARNEAPEF